MIQYFGWRTLFWGQLVLLVIASLVVATLLPTRRRAKAPPAVDEAVEFEVNGRKPSVWAGMDWVGSWSLAGGVTAFIVAGRLQDLKGPKLCAFLGLELRKRDDK